MITATKYKWLVQAVASHKSDACLLWPFAKDTKNGYGVVHVGSKMMRAHRVAFKLLHGHWPKPFGLHSCDTPACFNPRHIWEGTPKSNSLDAVTKGRMARGEQQGLSRLTEAQVIAIRAEYLPRKVGCQQLAKKYGVCPATIHILLKRKTWRHIA